MAEYAWVKLRADGRIVIPAAFRRALDVQVGDDLQIVLDDGWLSVLTKDMVLQEIQEWIGRYVPAGVSLVDELLAERRAEAERENAESKEWRRRAGKAHTGGEGETS